MRDTVFPVAPQQVLRDLVAEFKSSGPTYQRTVKATLKASYTNHDRAGLIKLLDVLEFRSNNTTHRPVLGFRVQAPTHRNRRPNGAQRTIAPKCRGHRLSNDRRDQG